MLEKATVPQRIEIDPNTGLVFLVFAKCVVDTDTGELFGQPEPHRVPIEPGQDYDAIMTTVNDGIVRDLKAAPIAQDHLDQVKRFVDFTHTKEVVDNYKVLQEKANLLSPGQAEAPKE